MLSMNVINNLDYYADLASEDYYNSGGEPAGVWSGLGAKALELSGKVKMEDYRNVFRGFSPNGDPLCENAGDHHRAGWDLTFSAPKSVSILWARSDVETQTQLQEAQLKATQQAVRFLEQHAAHTRRGHGGQKLEPVAGLVTTLYEHSTSRAQDPQLHTHCLVSNVAPRLDGGWGTLQSRQLYLWQKSAGALYRAELAKNLCELGFEVIEPDGADIFEVRGIPQQACEHFSKRAEAIEAALSESNIISSASRAGDMIKLVTRTHKQQVDRKQLFSRWQHELNELGLYSHTIQSIRDTQRNPEAQPLPLSCILESAVEKQSVFRLQDLYTAVAVEAQWHHGDLQTVESTVNHFIDENEIVTLGRDHLNNQIYSTPEMIAKEEELVHLADQLQEQDHYQLSEQEIEAAIKNQCESQEFSLSEEQSEAVFGVCQSSLDILQGVAGGGKSTSMQAVRTAYETAGFNVIGATVARQAANQLEAETGITSHTIAKLLDGLEQNRLQLNNTVLLVDEAGQLSSPDLLRLLAAVKQASGKLILVGEQQQMDAITHGGSLRYLSQRQGCARIETIRRQRKSWAREAVKQLRAGNAEAALNSHQKRGQLNFSNNSTESREQLVKKWSQFVSQNPDKQTLILAQRWRDVKPLNESIRKIHQDQGKIGHEDIEADCAVSNKVMRFQYSTGEQVRFTRNDYRRGYTNGDIGTIEEIDRLENGDIKFIIRCQDGRTVNFKQSDYCDEKGNLYLVQAYATTVYASQGSTIDGDVFIYYTSGMDRSASYVAGSRHKDNCHWFVNREEIDALSGAKDSGLAVDDNKRLQVLSRCMSTNRIPYLAIEYLENSEQYAAKKSNEKAAKTLEAEAC